MNKEKEQMGDKNQMGTKQNPSTEEKLQMIRELKLSEEEIMHIADECGRSIWRRKYKLFIPSEVRRDIFREYFYI